MATTQTRGECENEVLIHSVAPGRGAVTAVAMLAGFTKISPRIFCAPTEAISDAGHAPGEFSAR
jgi:hypothetical protein